MKLATGLVGKTLGILAGLRTADTISRRITSSALMLTILMVAGVGSISFGTLYVLYWENIEHELDRERQLMRQHLDGSLNRLAFDLAKLATNSFILNGIVNPAIRETSLSPTLHEHLPPVPHPVTLVAYDGNATPVATNASGDINRFGQNSMVGEALRAGRPLASVQSDAEGRQVLQMVYPLIGPANGRTEGALLGSVQLDSIFEDSTAQLETSTTRRDFLISGPASYPPGWHDDPAYIQRTWKAALVRPLDSLGLSVRIGRERAQASALLRRIAVIYGVFGLVSLLIAMLLAHRIGRRIAAPIAALSRTAAAVAASGSFDIKAEVHGTDEAAMLAHAFNDMLDRLRSSQTALQARQREFSALVENSPDLIARFDRGLRCTYVNRKVQAFFGLTVQSVVGRTAQELGVHRRAVNLIARLFECGGEEIYEFAANGCYFEARFVSEHDDGKVVSVLGILRDISARRRAEESLRLANRAIESSINPMLIAACQPPHYPIQYVNPAFERVTGYAADEAIGRDCRFLQGDGTAQAEIQQIDMALAEQREVRVELRNYRKDGSSFWNGFYLAPVHDAKGEVTHFVGEINDVTTDHDQHEQLHHQATHDPLTGLPNRNLLTDRLAQAISYAQRYERVIVVAFLDLDKFKQINDSLGHEIGDQLLKIVAARLTECVRDSDTVARLGGDEFVLVLYDQANEDMTYHAMQRVLSSISQPMALAGNEYTITCSIGFAVYPQDGLDADTLIRNADTAMYRAKELGRDNFQFCTEDLHARINSRLALETGLRHALDKQEFVLHYLPRIALSNGRITGMEALIRWNNRDQGMLEPCRFVPLAEEMGLIHHIGAWVMREACRQQRLWRQQGVADVPVAVNVSGAEFLRKDFAREVDRVLHETGIEPARLEIEITESLSMQDAESTIRVLHELKKIGVLVSIDDFGTGYSNLSYVKRFPVDTIKLDRRLVQDIVRNPEDLAISKAVISMAHSLHLKVTAEGVETATQLALLADHGCDSIQGFYFSQALPLDDCTELLRENRALPSDLLGRHRSDRTVLLIDDEPHVLSALERSLHRKGFRILAAHNASEAFDLMAMHEVGVILCDQRMPEMTGVEFFARIRYMYPAAVRMILSGYADINAVTNAINMGAVYKFLNKPWDANELCLIIAEAFDKYENDVRVTRRKGRE